MVIYKFGKLFEWLYPKRIWSVGTKEKIIYLTFDDGPIPEVTPFVLAELQKVNAKATFFMVGDNIKKNQEVFLEVLAQGHKVANHTMNHVKGTSCLTKDYLENVHSCDQQLKSNNAERFMRPPYGKITKSQEKALKDYKIVMWSVLSNDFNPSISAKTCLENTIKYTKAGSVVLMHDSVKTHEKLKEILPLYLRHFTNLGYSFKVLEI
jgi:peptidoglycan-N-acetylglucosamine deacetylase